MLRLVVVMAVVSAAMASHYDGRRGHGGYDVVALPSQDYGVDRGADEYGYSGHKGKETEQDWRGFPFDDGDDDDDDADLEGWGGSHKKSKRKNKHNRRGDGEDGGYGKGKGHYGQGEDHGDGDGDGDGRGSWDPHGHGRGSGRDKHGKYDDGLPGGDPVAPQDPMSPVRSAIQIRQDTESFASAVLAWVNDLVTPEAASTLVIDTSFSLTKSEGANFQPGSQTSSGLARLFPAVQKFVSSPQDVDLVEEDIQALGWTAALVSGGLTNTAELEGGIYATFQMICDELVILNISISSSGSTPTIRGQPVENSGLYVDVSILDGTIQATDAQGSVIGLIKRRHYPENAAEVLKNWTATAQGCAASKTFAVTGSVGGGWTEYKPDNSTPADYEDFAIGYSESFSFAFPEEATAAVADAAPPGLLRANAVDPFLPVKPPPSDVTAAIATAYVQWGVSCGQSPAAHKLSCGELAVMAQLRSFHEYAELTNNHVSHATQLEAKSTTEGFGGAMYAGIACAAAAAAVALAMLTQRRRSGYQGLATHA